MFTTVFFIAFTIVLSPTEHIGLIGDRFPTMDACVADMEAGKAYVAQTISQSGFSNFSVEAHCLPHTIPTNGF